MTALDINLNVDGDGNTCCAHCHTVVGEAGGGYLNKALWRTADSQHAGAHVVRADPALFVDREVVFRQVFCPSCLALFLTEVAPKDEPSYRQKALTA